MFRRLTSTQLAADVIAGVVWMLFGVFVARIAGLDLLILVVALLCAALALRRLSPALSLGIAWAGALLQVALGVGPYPFDLPIFGVLYATAAYGGSIVRTLGLISAPVGAAVIAVAQWITTPDRLEDATGLPGLQLPASVWSALTTFLGYLVAFLLAWTLGSLVRVRRATRAARLAEAAAQREIVVEQERNRIARDVHDVVAHSLAVVIAQADGARYAAGVDEKDAALATISSTAREALGDVRLLLSRLRHEEAAAPQPSLADLDALFEQLRSSGLDVQVERSGTPLALPPGQQLAVYRIVQEALTNALRHGDPGAPVVVRLDWSPTGLSVVVRNRSSTGTLVREGHGLPGMRERAALAGGQLESGPNGPEWVMTVTIPVGAA